MQILLLRCAKMQCLNVNWEIAHLCTPPPHTPAKRGGKGVFATVPSKKKGTSYFFKWPFPNLEFLGREVENCSVQKGEESRHDDYIVSYCRIPTNLVTGCPKRGQFGYKHENSPSPALSPVGTQKAPNSISKSRMQQKLQKRDWAQRVVVGALVYPSTTTRLYGLCDLETELSKILKMVTTQFRIYQYHVVCVQATVGKMCSKKVSFIYSGHILVPSTLWDPGTLWDPSTHCSKVL